MTCADERLEAGRIAAKIRRKLVDAVYPGRYILELCEEIEKEARQLGGTPAFPCNVGINEIAAHYTSEVEDRARIPRDGLVKVDFGVHINGYIADTAVSIPLSPRYYPMVRAVDDALRVAVESLRPGIKAREIGTVIERTIKSWGYQPIKNLMGHKMERFVLHAGKSIPNISSLDGANILKGEVYAVEPFLTTSKGKGSVAEKDVGFIYRLHREKGVKDKYAKKLVNVIRERFYTLPFTLRWLRSEMENPAFKATLQTLVAKGCLRVYPVLVEETNAPVAQAEHTILITGDGCIILTE